MFGLWGARRLGLAQGSWWRALAGLMGLQALTRLTAPAEGNVNLAFALWPGSEAVFPSYATYWLALLVGWPDHPLRPGVGPPEAAAFRFRPGQRKC